MKAQRPRMVDRVMNHLRAMTAEDWGVSLLGASFFIGIWYAFPMVNIITDVWGFGGGVLRAMEAHTLLPGNDVPYGTVSFYQNYIGMAIALVTALPFFGFDLAALKAALMLHPAYSLMVPRVVSALTAITVLAFVYRFLKSHVDTVWWRLALLTLIFDNVLTVLLSRSGKMWVLSVGLSVISFIYLYRALTEERQTGKPGRLSLISIGSAFLAAANFFFAGLFLVNIPILYVAFPRTRESFGRLLVMVAGGIGMFLFFFALNAENTIKQLSEFVIPLSDPAVSGTFVHARLTFVESLMVNGRQAIEAFPLLLLAVLFALWGGVRDKLLARLSLFYIAIYIVAVAFVFRTNHGLALNVRHIFPLGFFLMFFIAAHRLPRQHTAIAFFGVGVVLYFYVLFLLSVPATYNVASNFIVEHYGSTAVRIDENVFELTLPMNKASYALFKDASCGSTCKYMRQMQGDISFLPVVVTGESDPVAVAALPPPDLLVTAQAVSGCVPIARFGNNVPDDEVFDIDINLGRMLMPSFYHLTRLGKNIYLYDAKTCDASAQQPLFLTDPNIFGLTSERGAAASR